MARPRKYNADYFSHDNNMRNHRKIKAIRNKFDLAGYAVFNMLLETLTECDNFRLKLEKNIDFELLAADFGVNCEQFKDMLNYFVELGLIIEENNEYLSNNLIDRFTQLLDKREFLRQKYNSTKVSGAEIVFSGAETPHSKVKESKVKESKDIVSIDSSTPSKKASQFFSDLDYQETIVFQIAEKYQTDALKVKNEINKFISYWTEPNKSGTRQRWEMEKVFEVSRRLATWFSRSRDFAGKTSDGISKVIKI